MKTASFRQRLFLEAGEFPVARFPLTPALSLGEREKRSLLFSETSSFFYRKTDNGFGSRVHKIYKTIKRLFPLPQGEGQGEGKRAVQYASAHNLQ
jgi:hypothetical protein